jgi:predicted MPP superfamily phosphohydrolase
VDFVDFLDLEDVERALELRLGRIHARQRRGIEIDNEARKFGQGLTFLHYENLPIFEAVVAAAVRLSGSWGRGRANAARVRLCLNEVVSDRLPAAFDGFTILHLTDLHADMSETALVAAARMVSDLRYDLCVMTGDFRGKTFGPYHASLANMRRLREALRGDVYGVMGNHDTVLMLPDLERMGIQMLMNEHLTIERGADEIFLAGIDDAHFYRVDNIEKVAAAMPENTFSVLLSHTPEIFRQASHAGFDLLLAGHTHGGQICLPGGIPVILSSRMPRALGKGAWKHRRMAGYTSVGTGACGVPVRFNCPPEVTLHTLRKAG